MPNRYLLFAAYILSLFIYSINTWFSVSSILAIAAVCVLLFIIIFHRSTLTTVSDNPELACSAILIFQVGIMVSQEAVDINVLQSAAMIVSRTAMLAALLLSATYFIRATSSRFLKLIVHHRFALLIGCAAVILILIPRIVKDPGIDVFTVLRNGPERLIHRTNPYTTPAATGNSSDAAPYQYYAYGPTTIFAFLPFDLLFKDPRYLYVVTIFAAGAAVYFLSKQAGQSSVTSQLLALLFIFNPKQTFFVTQAWTDGLIVALVAISLFFISRQKYRWAGLLVGLALGVKIFYLLPYLFFFKLKQLRNKSFVFAAFITTLVLHLPFVLNNWRTLYASLVTLNIGPEALVYIRRAGLTFGAFVDRQFHWYPPELFFRSASLILFGIFWLILPKTAHLSKMLVSVALVFLLVIFFGPVGNASYYFSGSMFLLFALATLKEKGREDYSK